MFSALWRKVASAETLLWLKWLFRAWPPPHSCRRESGRELSFSLSFFFKICITPSVFWKWQNAISANSRCWLAYSQQKNIKQKTKQKGQNKTLSASRAPSYTYVLSRRRRRMWAVWRRKRTRRRTFWWGRRPSRVGWREWALWSAWGGWRPWVGGPLCRGSQRAWWD